MLIKLASNESFGRKLNAGLGALAVAAQAGCATTSPQMISNADLAKGLQEPVTVYQAQPLRAAGPSRGDPNCTGPWVKVAVAADKQLAKVFDVFLNKGADLAPGTLKPTGPNTLRGPVHRPTEQISEFEIKYEGTVLLGSYINMGAQCSYSSELHLLEVIDNRPKTTPQPKDAPNPGAPKADESAKGKTSSISIDDVHYQVSRAIQQHLVRSALDYQNG